MAPEKGRDDWSQHDLFSDIMDQGYPLKRTASGGRIENAMPQ